MINEDLKEMEDLLDELIKCSYNNGFRNNCTLLSIKVSLCILREYRNMEKKVEACKINPSIKNRKKFKELIYGKKDKS